MRCADPGSAARLAAALLVLLLGACSMLTHKAPAPAPAPQAVPATGAEGAPAQDKGAPAAQGAAPPAPAAVPAEQPLDPALRAAFVAALADLQAGKTDAARAQFAALAKSNPELGGPHANLGLLYRRDGKLDESVAELELAVRADERQPVYWNQLGIAYRLQGRFDKAREAYERAIALEPKYAMARLNLGVLFDLYLWDGAHALEQYEQYLALTPGGDEKVGKWIADLRNRARAQAAAASPQDGKEQR